MGEAALAVRGLTKRYSGRAVLDRVELTLEENRVYALLGEPGSGKTTLFRCGGGLCRPDEGEISILGNLPRDLTAARREAGLLIDQPAYCADLTVLNNVRLQARIIGGVDKKRIASVMQAMGITPRQTGRRSAGACSPAVRLSLAVALAFLGAPRLIMLDEPYSGMDGETAELLKRLLERERGEHPLTAVISGQFFADLYPVATDFIIMDRGRVLAQMTKRDIEARLPAGISRSGEYEAFYRALAKEGGAGS
jgi:ABC-2 type transport system ATP-binding protein